MFVCCQDSPRFRKERKTVASDTPLDNHVNNVLITLLPVDLAVNKKQFHRVKKDQQHFDIKMVFYRKIIRFFPHLYINHVKPTLKITEDWMIGTAAKSPQSQMAESMIRMLMGLC